jgi:hypothetical protein
MIKKRQHRQQQQEDWVFNAGYHETEPLLPIVQKQD